MRVPWLMDIGKKTMSGKRWAMVAAAALGLYSVGDEGYSYVSTATRLMSHEFEEHIPLSFEIERARTMISKLAPDIKRNMVLIAQEEVSTESLRKEIQAAEASLADQQATLLELRKKAESGEAGWKIGNRYATSEEVDRELERRFTRFRVGEATVSAKQELLVSREESLMAARAKLEAMLSAKRDLEVQTENLEARVRTLQGEAMASHVEFDDLEVTRCQALVNSLKARLEVAERLIVAEGADPIGSMSLTNLNVRDDIDRYFAARSD